jgi:site-specific DNA-cytosine methylase
MIHIGLFEGIGGFSLAVQWMGWKTLVTCEINPFGQNVTNTNSSGRSEKCEFTAISNKPGRFNSETNTIRRPGSWEAFPTESPVCSRNDGISAGLVGITFSKWRNESIKSLGNTVVPGLVLQIFKAIQQYEDNHRES